MGLGSLQAIILIFHTVFAVIIVALILLQQGKGMAMGSAMGSGASQTMFGARGSAPFLLKLTVLFAALFFASSLALDRLSTQQIKNEQPIVIAQPVNTTSPPSPSGPISKIPVQ